MYRLVRLALRILDRLSKKQGAIQCLAQRHGGRDIAFEMSGYGSDLNNVSIGRRNVARNRQGNADDTIEVRQRGGPIKIDDWERGARKRYASAAANINGALTDVSNYGCGVCHGGSSYKLFKWNAAEGCMMPFEKSNPPQGGE